MPNSRPSRLTTSKHISDEICLWRHDGMNGYEEFRMEVTKFTELLEIKNFGENFNPQTSQVINSLEPNLQGFIDNELSGYTLSAGDIITFNSGNNYFSYIYTPGNNEDPTDINNYSFLSYFEYINPVTQELHTATINVGAISINEEVPIGSSLDQFIEQLIAPYVPPSFNSFVINGRTSGILEVGQSLTPTDATWSAINDSRGNVPTNINIVGDGFLPSTIVTANPHLIDDIPTSIVVRSTAGNLTWTIQGLDYNSNVISRNATRTWYYRFKFGASSTIVTDNTSAEAVYSALQQSSLLPGKATTVTCGVYNNDPANYTYIMYYSGFGDLTAVNQGVLPVLTAFTKLGDFTVSNGFQNVSVRIYKSNATGAFANGVNLVIT